MKLLLCSDFSGVGYKFLNKFYANTSGLTCLFVGYAQEDDNELESYSAKRFKDLGINVVSLTKNYKFADKIDIIFVRGGNTTRLLHYLRIYGQFDKIKMLMMTQNILFVGSSAGAILAGTDTAFTLEAEPYDENLIELFGEDALKGYGFVSKLVFVHASKWRMCWTHEKTNENDEFLVLDRECYPAYLEDKKKFKKRDYIKIGNNEVLLIDGDQMQMCKDNWRGLRKKLRVRKTKTAL